MKRAYNLLLVAIFLIAFASYASASGEGFGYAHPDPAVTIEETTTPWYSFLFSITGLKSGYEQGSHITVASSQRLLPGQSCTGESLLVVEYYNSQQQLQTTYIGGNYKSLGSGLQAGVDKSFVSTFILPNRVLQDNGLGFTVDARNTGTYSMSAYILCPEKNPVNANTYSTVNERAFYVFAPIVAGTTSTIPKGTTTTIPQPATTTTVIQGNKLDLLSYSIAKSQMNVGDSQTVFATFQAKEAGTYVLESFYQSTNEQFSIFSIVPIDVNRCDILNGVTESPDYRNEKVTFAKDEIKTVSFTFPPHTFGGNFIAYIDATSDCRVAPDLIQNTRVSGYKVVSGNDGGGNTGELCTKSINAPCTPPNEGLIEPLSDGSGANTECATGWCRDIFFGSGRCALAGTAANGKITFPKIPAQECVDRGTVPAGTFDFLTVMYGPLPIWAWVAVVIIVLFLFASISGGGGRR